MALQVEQAQQEARYEMLGQFEELILQRNNSIESQPGAQIILPALAKEAQKAGGNNYSEVDLVGLFDEDEAEIDVCPIQVQVKDSCDKQLECGHPCLGVQGSEKCLPCLEPGCEHKCASTSKEELCSICYTSELAEESCVALACGHIFHTTCVGELFKHRWSTLKVSFAFLSCPSCKAEITSIDCLPLKLDLDKLLKLKESVETEALKVAERQGILEDSRLQTPGDHFHEKPLQWALYKCSFYECAKCLNPFFGGLVDCELEQANQEQHQDAKKEDLRCQTCLLEDLGAGVSECETHGNNEVDWKCCYCCSVALFHCGGSMYMCEACHDEYCAKGGQVELKDCEGKNCPLQVKHPPASLNTAESCFPIGCGLCRTLKMEEHNARLGIAQVLTEEAYKPKLFVKADHQEQQRQQQLQQQQQQPAVPRQNMQQVRQRAELQRRRRRGEEIRFIRNLEMPAWMLDQDQIEEEVKENELVEQAENEMPAWFVDDEGNQDDPMIVHPQLDDSSESDEDEDDEEVLEDSLFGALFAQCNVNVRNNALGDFLGELEKCYDDHVEDLGHPPRLLVGPKKDFEAQPASPRIQLEDDALGDFLGYLEECYDHNDPVHHHQPQLLIQENKKDAEAPKYFSQGTQTAPIEETPAPSLSQLLSSVAMSALRVPAQAAANSLLKVASKMKSLCRGSAQADY